MNRLTYRALPRVREPNLCVRGFQLPRRAAHGRQPHGGFFVPTRSRDGARTLIYTCPRCVRKNYPRSQLNATSSRYARHESRSVFVRAPTGKRNRAVHKSRPRGEMRAADSRPIGCIGCTFASHSRCRVYDVFPGVSRSPARIAIKFRAAHDALLD